MTAIESGSWTPLWRIFVLAALIALHACSSNGGVRESNKEMWGLPVTGDPVPELRSFDQAMRELVMEFDVPGASLAVARDGKVIFARGYGWADTLARIPVSPRHRFRIASVSKPVTAIAVLKLVEQGMLSLDDRPFEILGVLGSVTAEPADSRLRWITIAQLLRHRGGFDRTVGPDPTLTPGGVAREMGIAPPVGLDQIIRFMAGRPLDYEPGSKTVYSNFGYAVLGRLIEVVTDEDYAVFVREEVLAPIGVKGMMLGRPFPDERPGDEVSYYHPPPPDRVPAIPPRAGRVPLPDGGFDLGIMAAHGGWIATPTDLVRLVAAVDGVENPPDLLAPATVQQMLAPPEAGVDTAYYAMGWFVRPASGGLPQTWWHVGDLPGTTALLMHRGRISWAALLNRSPWSATAHDTIRKVLESAADRVTRWPDEMGNRLRSGVGVTATEKSM